MDTQLQKKIDSIIDSLDNKFDWILIRLECPLESGIKIQISGSYKGEPIFPNIEGGIKDFFLYVKKVKQRNNNSEFNVIEFNVDKNKKIIIKSFFDKVLQEQTEANIG